MLSTQNANVKATVAQSPLQIGKVAIKVAYKLINHQKVKKKSFYLLNLLRLRILRILTSRGGNNEIQIFSIYAPLHGNFKFYYYLFYRCTIFINHAIYPKSPIKFRTLNYASSRSSFAHDFI